MGNYNLSIKAQEDLVEIYKYGGRIYGIIQATKYLIAIESLFEELSDRPEIARDVPFVSDQMKRYNYKAHVVFYKFDEENSIFIIRILGKRMNFIDHL